MSDIQYRNLGRNGVKVSPITLGTMMFGGQTPDDVARRITDRAFEQGINSIDTANGYNDGASEAVVGRLIGDRRQHWVLPPNSSIPTRAAAGRTTAEPRART